MIRVSRIRTLAAGGALAVMAACVAPVSGADDEKDWLAFSKARDDAIVACILERKNSDDCSDLDKYKFNPRFDPTNPDNFVQSLSPALTGPSAADIFHQHWNEGLNQNPSAGSLPSLQ